MLLHCIDYIHRSPMEAARRRDAVFQTIRLQWPEIRVEGFGRHNYVFARRKLLRRRQIFAAQTLACPKIVSPAQYPHRFRRRNLLRRIGHPPRAPAGRALHSQTPLLGSLPRLPEANRPGFLLRTRYESHRFKKALAMWDSPPVAYRRGACGTQRERISFVHRLCKIESRQFAARAPHICREAERGPGRC